MAACACSCFAADITFDAATLGGTGDLGTLSRTVAGSDGTSITVASTGSGGSNLFSAVLAGGLTGANVAALGIMGGGEDTAVRGAAGEQMTVTFAGVASVSQITFSGCGVSDDDLIIENLPASPGNVTFATLGSATVTNLDYSYSASNKTLTIDFSTLGLSTGGTFAFSIVVNFQKPVFLNSFSFSADQSGNAAGGAGLNSIVYEAQPAATVAVNVDVSSVQWKISPYLVGLHMVYSGTPDSAYADGSVVDWTRRVGIGTSRYPGGTVVKYWDWEHPTGVITGDTWDPTWDPANNQPPSKWMSLDEYLDFVTTSGIRPLFGVNSLSGQTYDREADGIDRAVRMVNYVKARGYGGALWYIGNEEESYYPGGISGYAKVFKRYAQAMKAADPDILIFWNHNGATAGTIQTFLDNDGGTADGLETHGKWPYGGDPDGYAPGTYAEWLDEVPLRDRKNSNRAWRFAANTYRQAAAAAGRPGLLIANNEYGIGKDINVTGFNRYGQGLCLTEMLMEHFIGNWFSACFWDMSLQSDRGLLDEANNFRFNPVNFGMNMLADSAGGNYMDTVSTIYPSLHGFAARKNGVLMVYLLNKTTNAQPVIVQLAGASFGAGYARSMQPGNSGYGKLVTIPVDGQGSQFSATLPSLTFTEFAFANPNAYTDTPAISMTNGSVNLLWKSIPGALYTIEKATTFSGWQEAQTNIAPDNLWTETTLPAGTNSQTFYRLSLQP